jgi:hypothetical protein
VHTASRGELHYGKEKEGREKEKRVGQTKKKRERKDWASPQKLTLLSFLLVLSFSFSFSVLCSL